MEQTLSYECDSNEKAKVPKFDDNSTCVLCLYNIDVESQNQFWIWLLAIAVLISMATKLMTKAEELLP